MQDRLDTYQFEPETPEISLEKPEFVDYRSPLGILHYTVDSHTALENQPGLNRLIQQAAAIILLSANDSGHIVDQITVRQPTSETEKGPEQKFIIGINSSDSAEISDSWYREHLDKMLSEFDESLNPEDRIISDAIEIELAEDPDKEAPYSGSVNVIDTQKSKPKTKFRRQPVPKPPTKITRRGIAIRAGLSVLGIAAAAAGTADVRRRLRRDDRVEEEINQLYPPVTNTQYKMAHDDLDGISKGKPISQEQQKADLEVLGERVINTDEMRIHQTYPFSNTEGAGQFAGIVFGAIATSYLAAKLLQLRGRKMKEIKDES